MKAAVLNASNGIFDVEDIQIDQPKGREVLVEVKASGLCHSDLHMAESDFGVPLPAVFGHELAGVVKSIGPDVREFKIGDHVVGTSAFAEYSLVHENQLVKVPDALPFPQAAILGCGCVTGAGAAINTANVKPGERRCFSWASAISCLATLRLSSSSCFIWKNIASTRLSLN